MIEKVDDPKRKFKVIFWGVRGSIPTPSLEYLKYGGNTACIEINIGNKIIIVDAGTGIFPLGNKLKEKNNLDIDLLLTHTHLDHISGLPFFAPLFNKSNRIRIWAGHLNNLKIKNVLSSVMSDPLFPVPIEIFQAQVSYHEFKSGNEIYLGDNITIKTCSLNHPQGATGYRFDYLEKSLAVITDTEHKTDKIDCNIVNLCKDSEYIIYDSSYTDEEFSSRVGWGHSTWQEATRIAKAAGNNTKAILFHHAPERKDKQLDRIDIELQQLLPGSLIAREGLEINLL